MKIPTQTTGDISLYIHIPFCLRKCPYCHFYSIKYSIDYKKSFLLAILKEIKDRLIKLDNREIVSIYFGGGTPSLLGPDFFEKILKLIFSIANVKNDCEITIETNPEDVTLEKFKKLKKIMINRVSIGVQSFDDFLLKKIGRNHSSKDSIIAIENINNAGFNNISIDLMYDIFHQTFSMWENTLSTIKTLNVQHISIYNLIIEEESYFFKIKDQLSNYKPDENLPFINHAEEVLNNFGFQRYEISAFAKNSKISIHNSGYWTAREFLGFGPSAFSFYDNIRSSNIKNVAEYINRINNNESPTDFVDKISDEKRKNELFVIALRLMHGVDLNEFIKKHGIISKEYLHKLKSLKEKGLLIIEKENVKLSDKGKLFYDEIAVELI